MKNKRSIRRILLTGLALTAPLYLTFLIVRFVFKALAAPFSPAVIVFFQSLNINIPEVPWIVSVVSVILTLCMFYIVGLVGDYVLTKKLLYKLESLIFSIPFVKAIYGTMKKMVSLFTDSSEQLYEKVVLARFPDEKSRMIGFITGNTVLNGEEYVNVFVPTSPNPTSGFLMFIKTSDITELSISVEEAIQLIISAGTMEVAKKLDIASETQKVP